MTDIEPLQDRAWKTKHAALRNAVYHSARRRWLDSNGRILNFLVIVAGTSAASDILDFIPNSFKLAAFIVAIIGAIQLVFDFGGRARTHEILQKRYFELLAEVEECAELNDVICRKWEAALTRISADEPPILRAVDAIADNQATQYMTGVGNRIRINFWQSATRHLFAHHRAKFPISPPQ